MILVDTSVWIDHLHRRDAVLVDRLEHHDVAAHPMVVGELALGSLARRSEVLALLRNLTTTRRATDDEVLHLIEEQRLASRGLSLVDAHLLAATLLTPNMLLWTRDKRLHAVAADRGLVWNPPRR